ncbi:hypothetical protein KC963_04750, partial [Candidatus Saccharibacteria bacterium]|nr:hypothetical protein [Candidatus Saccharibacteria bacterium]
MSHYSSFLADWLKAEQARHRGDVESSNLLQAVRRNARSHNDDEAETLCLVTELFNRGEYEQANALISKMPQAGQFDVLRLFLHAKLTHSLNNSIDPKNSLYSQVYENYSKDPSDVVRTICGWAQNNHGLKYHSWIITKLLAYPFYFSRHGVRTETRQPNRLCTTYIKAAVALLSSALHSAEANASDGSFIENYNLAECYFIEARNQLKCSNGRWELTERGKRCLTSAISHLQHSSSEIKKLEAQNKPLSSIRKAILLQELGTYHLWNSDPHAAIMVWKQSLSAYLKSEREGLANRYKKAIVQEKLRDTLRLTAEAPSLGKNVDLAFLLNDVSKVHYKLDPTRLLWTSDSEDALAGEATPGEELYAQLTAINFDAYEKYLATSTHKHEPAVGFEVQFLCARGWASSIPLLMNTSNTSKALGGGYYIVSKVANGAQARGIVIDPGHNYLANMHSLGHRATEFTDIFVSHDHTDHCAEVLNIDDVLYDLSNRASSDTRQRFNELKWYLYSNTFETVKKHYGTHQSHSHRAKAILENGMNDVGKVSKCDIPHHCVVHTSEVHHVENTQTVASLWRFKSNERDNGSVLYTADLEWSIPSNSRSHKSAAALKELCGELPSKVPDVMIAHISQIELRELLYENQFKNAHLGLNGLVECIKCVRPRYVLIGEFWGGLSDTRLITTLVVAERLDRMWLTEEGKRPEILPLDIGFRMYLRPDPDEEVVLPVVYVECSECQDQVAFENMACV